MTKIKIILNELSVYPVTEWKSWKVVYVNGELLDEPYLWETPRGSFGPYEVPEGHYFMLGDNRNNSRDSRYWNNKYVSDEQILGKAYWIYYPQLKSVNH